MDEATIQAYMQAMGVTREQAIAALSASQAMLGYAGLNSGKVFLGETTSVQKKKTRGAATKTVKSTSVNTKSAEEIYNDFWTNDAVQNQVMSYLRLIGKENLGRPGGYEVWKDVVDQAADIYRDGKGSKITPTELLNMSMQGASATGINIDRQIREYDKDVLREFAQSVALKVRGKKFDETELADAMALADKIIQKGVMTKTEQVRNPKTGKMENVSTTKGGFTQERFEAELGKKIEKETPELVQRRKAFEFNDIMKSILSGGM